MQVDGLWPANSLVLELQSHLANKEGRNATAGLRRKATTKGPPTEERPCLTVLDDDRFCSEHCYRHAQGLRCRHCG
jgi:hypothetical protein